MKNAEKYMFQDFTLAHYQEILDEIKSHHKIISFQEASLQSELSCIIRHDIDFSSDSSVQIAKIEQENNIRSIFFINLHSEFYNALEKNNVDKIRKIASLGHEIGIHFDVHYYGLRSSSELISKLSLERDVFFHFFNYEVNTFSFHNTNEWILKQSNVEYAGLINAYSSFFKENFAYCSDSNGYWRFKRMIDTIKENKNCNLHVLTHPLWWTQEVNSPRSKILSCIDSNNKSLYSMYSKTLKTNGRLNIDWDEID